MNPHNVRAIEIYFFVRLPCCFICCRSTSSVKTQVGVDGRIEWNVKGADRWIGRQDGRRRLVLARVWFSNFRLQIAGWHGVWTADRSLEKGKSTWKSRGERWHRQEKDSVLPFFAYAGERREQRFLGRREEDLHQKINKSNTVVWYLWELILCYKFVKVWGSKAAYKLEDEGLKSKLQDSEIEDEREQLRIRWRAEKKTNSRDEGNGYNSACAGNDPRRPAKVETILLKPWSHTLI